MRIGIDAKWYFNGPPSGKTVVSNLVDNLIADDRHVFFLFMNKVDFLKHIDFREKFKNCKNIHIIPIQASFPNFLINLLVFPFYYKKLDLDVILYQNFTPLFKFSSKVKEVVYIHDVLFIDFPQYFTRLEKLLYKFISYSAIRSDFIITTSKSEQQRIIRHYNIDKHKISFVYHGVSSDFASISEIEKEKTKKGLNLPDKYLLYVGRINERKNIATLIKSIPLIKNYDAKLVVVGEENNKVFKIDDFALKLGVSDRIIKLGHLNFIDLVKVMSSSTIFIFPSYAEGFGLPPLEAMKCGVPTIVSNQTSLPEICGDASLYFEVDSEESLAKQIDRLLYDQYLVKEIVDKGYEHVNNFTWKRSAESIIQILEKVTGNEH